MDGRLLHALGWAAIGAAACALVVACFLPGFQIAVEASIGAGFDQRSFRYVREFTIAGDLRPVGLMALAAGVLLVAGAVVAVVRGSRPWLVVACFLLAFGLLLLVFDVEDNRLGWAGDTGGVVGWEEPNGGPLLQGAIDDLQAAARRSPEAQEPGWELAGPYAYSARGRIGWDIFLRAALVLAWLTTYRLVRLRLRPLPAAAVVVGVSVLVFVWLLYYSLTRYA